MNKINFKVPPKIIFLEFSLSVGILILLIILLKQNYKYNHLHEKIIINYYK